MSYDYHGPASVAVTAKCGLTSALVTMCILTSASSKYRAAAGDSRPLQEALTGRFDDHHALLVVPLRGVGAKTLTYGPAPTFCTARKGGSGV